LSKISSSQKTSKRYAQFLTISWRHHETIPSIFYQISSAARDAAYDHRKSARHPFIHDQAPRITASGQNQSLRKSIEAGNVLTVRETGETNHSRVYAPGLTLQFA
jgi:hypothetical protein